MVQISRGGKHQTNVPFTCIDLLMTLRQHLDLFWQIFKQYSLWPQLVLFILDVGLYPDMLEVGQTNSQGFMPLLNFTEARTHFAAWAIVSSPLILGFELLNATAMDLVWPIITNREVLQVNQRWAGWSGSAFFSSPEKTHFSLCHWERTPCDIPTIQYLYKPQPNDQVAVLLMNNGETPRDLLLEFHLIPLIKKSGQYRLRNLWDRKDIPGTFAGSYLAKQVISHDAIFLLVTPLG